MKKAIIILCVVFSGCTENQRARQFGGKETINMKPNEVLLNVTWKNDDMWVLTEDTLTHLKHFMENSSFGILEGEVIIK